MTQLPAPLRLTTITVSVAVSALVLSAFSPISFGQETQVLPAVEPMVVQTQAQPAIEPSVEQDSVPNAQPAVEPMLLQTQAQPATTTGSNQVVTDEITVVASPTRVGEDRTLVLQPGERRQITVDVRNVSDKVIDVISTSQDFIIGDDGFTPIPIITENEASNRWSLANWLTIVPNLQSLRPNEIGQLNVLIEVPGDALPGGRYAMIVHEPMAEGTAARNEDGSADLTTSQSRVSQKVGTLLYIIVDGPINEAAFLRDFSFPRFTEYGPVPFSFTVDNQSDIHIAPQVSVDIFNIFGVKEETIVVDPRNVFPLMSREFESTWDRVWGFGYYTARATMSYGDAGSIVIANTSFWLLPITLVIAVIVILLTFIAMLFAIRRHIWHRDEQDKARIKELEERLQSMANPDAPVSQSTQQPVETQTETSQETEQNN